MAEQEAPNQTDSDDVHELTTEEAFRSAVRPHLDTLRQAARDDLDYYANRGLIREDELLPDDIIGETLVYAWQHRVQRPDDMRLRNWLLGMQHRVTRSLVDEIADYRRQKALSLDDEIPPDVRGRGFQERRQYGTQPEVNITWEDVTPGREPRDIEAPLFTNRDTFGLDPDTRHVVMMHDEFDMPLADVAATMDRTVDETAALLEDARTTLRQKTDASDASETPPPPGDQPS
jgi:RNA polymerase sigma-70 factor (ECF subfamily)